MTRSTAPLRFWMLALLASGSAILVVGMVGLWRSGRTVQSRAQEQATRSAVLEARRVRERLADPDLLRELPSTRRFQVQDGRLVIPDAVRWLVEPVDEPPDLLLPGAILRRLEEAERLEFVAGRRDEALAGLQPLLAREGLEPEAYRFVALKTAWTAQRGGDSQSIAALWPILAAEPAPEPAAVATGVLLLAGVEQRELPAWSLERWRRLPPTRATAVLQRLQVEHPAGADWALWHATLRDTVATRRTLQVARAHVSAWMTAGGQVNASTTAVGSEWLVVFPDADGGGGGGGAGALLGLADVERIVGALPESARLVAGAELPAAAIPVLPGLGVEPVEALVSLTWNRPWVLTALLAILGALWMTFLLLVLRAVRRETELARLRTEFLTSITHELKTPLASIRLIAEMLQEARVPADRTRHYHQLLAGEAGRLNVLLDNVLDLGRMERGERAYDFRMASPVDVLQEAVQLFEPVAEQQGLRLEVTFAGAPEAIALDRGALVQAFLNVLDNARKYAAAGQRVQVSGATEAEGYRVEVRDFGPGIPPVEREAVFDRFVRGAAQRSGAVPGLGLGLYLARRILRAHGGDLRVQPDPGPGARFVARLPLRPAAP